MLRATTSFPVPVSPRRSTGTSESFTFAIIRSMSFISGEELGARRRLVRVRSVSRKASVARRSARASAFLCDDGEEQRVIQGFLDVVRRAGLHALDGAVDVAMARDDDDGKAGSSARSSSRNRSPSLLSQAQVEEDELDVRARKDAPRFRRAKPPHGPGSPPARGAWRARCAGPARHQRSGRSCARSTTSTSVPLPGALCTRSSPPLRLTMAQQIDSPRPLPMPGASSS